MCDDVPVTEPPLRFLHAEQVLSQVKLEQFRRTSTPALIESLRPGQSGALKAKADGTVLEGHHRLVLLRERGINIDALPRETLPQKPEV
jgi:hypothetical protein